MKMYGFSIEILFCVVASVISTEFYIASSGKKAPKNAMILFIFATHMVIMLPFYDAFEVLLDIAQVAAEFIIILILLDAKILQKLLMYVELNLAFGIASIVALMVKSNKMMYCLVTLAVASIICVFIIRLQSKNKGKINNIGGKAISFVMSMAILCCLYVVGMVITELDENMMIIIYICFLFVIWMAYELIMINYKMQRSEDISRKHFIMNVINKKTDELQNTIVQCAKEDKERLERVRDYLNTLYGNVDDLYKIRKVILEKKQERAREYGCVIEVHEVVKAQWEGIEPIDCVIIMTNLLDNAIEATSKNCEENRRINVNIKKNSLLIENPYEACLINDGNFFLTTKTKGEHGLGITNVKNIVEKNGGWLKVSTDEGMFRVEIRMEVEK